MTIASFRRSAVVYTLYVAGTTTLTTTAGASPVVTFSPASDAPALGSGVLSVLLADPVTVEPAHVSALRDGELTVRSTAALPSMPILPVLPPDETRQAAPKEMRDCNTNNIDDDADIANQTSRDRNANRIPDECEVDCNTNGIDDAQDVADHTSKDCNTNQIPDECEPDCNTNGFPDDCDILEARVLDLDGNKIPDDCETNNNYAKGQENPAAFGDGYSVGATNALYSPGFRPGNGDFHFTSGGGSPPSTGLPPPPLDGPSTPPVLSDAPKPPRFTTPVDGPPEPPMNPIPDFPETPRFDRPPIDPIPPPPATPEPATGLLLLAGLTATRRTGIR